MLLFHSQNLVFSVMYKTPSDVDFYSVLDRQLDSICSKRKTVMNMIMSDQNANLLNTRRYSNAALERKESTDACQISAVDGCRDTKDHEQKIQAAAKGTKIR